MATGLTFPVTFPVTFGVVPPSGVTVDNAGNSNVSPVLVITGPVTNPIAQNATLAGTPYVMFANPDQTSYTVLAGDQLVVDLGAHTALYYTGGVSSGSQPASRLGWLVSGSSWWQLAPGNNLVQFRSQDASPPAGTLQIQWADAYML